MSTDVTEEVNARNALVHARRRELAAQLTSGLAHDFNNLLTIILGQQERLDAQPDLPPIQKEISQIIRSAAFRGAALIEDLSKVDAKRDLEIRPVHIPSLLENFALLAHAALPDKAALTITNELPDAILMLDAGFAQDALLNLVLNAGEAMGGPGSVTLKLERDDGPTLLVSVQDTGPGFTDHALNNALAPFYTSKRGKPGRGLGLSTAFDFAKTSGGRIHLGNAKTGGAKVTIRLPYQTPPQDPPGLILLVEDDPGDAILVERTLLRCQQRFSLQHCELLQDALISVADDQFDVALLDLSLPDSSGLEGVPAIVQAAGKSPVIVCTGLNDESVGQDAIRSGAQDYLVKNPQLYGSLPRTLRYAVERSRLIYQANRKLELAREYTELLLTKVISIANSGLGITNDEGIFIIKHDSFVLC